ncbi:fungal-specific transcription factor domain-containing protein [Zopfochytrium polystomum]|nr:fungal-specific transcription factor domain-containing protein [Zopfochytrium polystomum]
MIPIAAAASAAPSAIWLIDGLQHPAPSTIPPMRPIPPIRAFDPQLPSAALDLQQPLQQQPLLLKDPLPFQPAHYSLPSTVTQRLRTADWGRRWSCESCRNRKRKCDGVRPHCGRCVKDGQAFSCVFLGTKHKVDPVLARRHQLAATASKTAAKSSEPEVIPPNGLRISWPITADKLLEMFTNVSLIGQACPRTALTAVQSYPSSLKARPGADATEQDIFIDAYFRFAKLQVQVVHRLTFLKNRERAPAFLLAAICALGAADGTFRDLPQHVLKYYYESARSQALEWIDSPSLETLQALLILSHLSFFLGKVAVGRMLLGFACRLIEFLHVNVDPDDLPYEFTPVEKEERRRCWFFAYVLNSYTSVAMNRPIGLLLKQNSVKRISPDVHWLSQDPRSVDRLSPAPPNSPVDVFRSVLDIHLAILQTLADTTTTTAKRAPPPSPSPPFQQPTAPAARARQQRESSERRLAAWLASDPPRWATEPAALAAAVGADAAAAAREATGQAATPIRWRVCAFGMVHGSRLALSVDALLRILAPRLVRLPHTHPKPSDESDAVALQAALASGWTAATAVCAAADTLYRFDVPYTRSAGPRAAPRRAHTASSSPADPTGDAESPSAAAASRHRAALGALLERQRGEMPVLGALLAQLHVPVDGSGGAGLTPDAAAAAAVPSSPAASSSSSSGSSSAASRTTCIAAAVDAWTATPELRAGQSTLAPVLALHRLAVRLAGGVGDTAAVVPASPASAGGPLAAGGSSLWQAAADGGGGGGGGGSDSTETVGKVEEEGAGGSVGGGGSGRASTAAAREDWDKWDGLFAELLGGDGAGRR